MRHVIALLLIGLVGCTDDEVATEFETHELIDCDGRWAAHVQPFAVGVTQCEAACADAHAITSYTPTSICYVDAASRFNGTGRVVGEQTCGPQTEWRGHWGCCIPDSAPVTFIECKTE